MAHRMESFRKAVIAGDRCHDEVIYMPVLHQLMARQFVCFHLFQNHCILVPPTHPPTSVYSFNCTPGLCCTDMGVFLALGYENMPVQASIRY